MGGLLMGSHYRKIAIVGLGYVGLPIAAAFGKKEHVIAFDINKSRIDELIAGYDRTMMFTNRSS
jgi:UDP-N-acetyl-D-galactosamine dehydrogenase